MTKIKDIVSINSQAVFNNAIQLSWFYDVNQKTENDNLVSGYVFGNSVDNKKIGNYIESSSLPVFEKVIKAFGNPQASNIFTIVARYGHGKSHFALVLANYFGLAPDSPVVADIIKHIETCSDKPTADQFRYFKTQTTRPQFVVTLAGIDFQDLRQGFLQALRRALESHEATRNYPIKSISAKAAEWLNGLNGANLEKADDYLGKNHQTDVGSLIAALEDFETGKEPIVKDLSRIFNNGFALNFGQDVSLKEIVEDVVDNLCTGSDAPFHKMLILFDELGVYADKWCHQPTPSGGLAPQEIFEACLNRSGKVCFVGFVQRELGEFVKGYSAEIQSEFQKWAGRMHTDAVYHLVSNLEEVISKLLVKNSSWQQTIEDFAPRILEESTISRESIQRYHENWSANDFHNSVARNCFPLHPMTTGLLCSFDFTQGSRTIIGAVDSMLKTAQENEVSNNGTLKYIRPIELVKEFDQDFIKNNSRAFADYQDVIETAITTDAEPILTDVLQALFLFKEAKMTKQNKYDHAVLLAHLAGYSETETKNALERLQKEFDAVRYSPQKREYEFTGSTTSRKIVLDMANKASVGKRADSFIRLLTTLKAFENLIPQDSVAREFKADFAVEGDEWFLASCYLDASRLSLEEVKKLCKQTIDENTARGTVIYLISGNSAELDTARDKADLIFRKLKEENYAHPFVLAIPQEVATGLEKQILLKNYIDNEMSQPDKVRFAESHRSAREFVNKELNDELIAHLRTVEYFVPEELRLKFGTRHKSLDEIADALFENAYKFRAPSNSVSMRPNATTGNTATALIARQLIVNELNFDSFDTAKQNIIKQVLTEGTNKWGVLDAKNKIKEPKDVRVMQGWKFLSQNISKDSWTTFDKLISELTQPPYGYDEYTATFLIAAWIGKHKHELAFKDNRKPQPIRPVGTLPQNSAQANLSLRELQNILNKSKEFIKFLRSNVSVQNSGQEIQRAAKEYLAQIQQVKDTSEGAQLFAQAGQILQTLAANDELIPQINAALKDLAEFLKEAEGVEKNLDKSREVINTSSDISTLLRVQNALNSFGKDNGMQSNSVLVETLKAAENKINAVAASQSQAILQRIESYEAVRGNLEKNRQALNQAGRADLEKLFINALEKIEKDYQRIQAEADEKPTLNEIKSLQTNGMPLGYLINSLNRIEEILTNNLSENIQKEAKIKRQQLNEYIENLRDFVNKLLSRVEGINEIGKAQDLQSEIYQKQSKYENTPEAENIKNSLDKLNSRLAKLKDERRRQIELENEMKQQALANLTANRFSEEFRKISDASLRFKILEEILETVQNTNLSAEQKMHLKNLLD